MHLLYKLISLNIHRKEYKFIIIEINMSKNLETSKLINLDEEINKKEIILQKEREKYEKKIQKFPSGSIVILSIIIWIWLVMTYNDFILIVVLISIVYIILILFTFNDESRDTIARKIISKREVNKYNLEINELNKKREKIAEYYNKIIEPILKNEWKKYKNIQERYQEETGELLEYYFKNSSYYENFISEEVFGEESINLDTMEENYEDEIIRYPFSKKTEELVFLLTEYLINKGYNEINFEISYYSIIQYLIDENITFFEKRLEKINLIEIVNVYLKRVEKPLSPINLCLLCKILDIFEVNYNTKDIENEVKKQLKNEKLRKFANKIELQEIINVNEIDNMDGYKFEKFVAECLRKKNYKVKETSLSGDQGADLIVQKDNKDIAIQIKRYSGQVSNKAIQEVVGALKFYDCDEGIVLTNSYFTNSAKELAKKNQILLINRDSIIDFLEED